MPIVEVDKRGRIVIPKELRKEISLKPKEAFLIKISDKDTLILKKIEKKGRKPSSPIFGKPLHVSPKKLKKIDLEKIEEEMWLA